MTETAGWPARAFRVPLVAAVVGSLAITVLRRRRGRAMLEGAA